MKISVVTNAFNQGKYLAAAAESVLSQAGPEIEYLVVEPGSTDDTRDVLERMRAVYPGRFVVIDEPDDGPADGLNRGFARATGDWFVYLNADDAFLNGAFRGVVSALEKNSSAGAVIGSGYIVDDEGRYLRRAISTKFDARRFVQGTAFALQQSTFYRADAFRAVGGFNLANRTSWDAELLVDIDRAGYPLVTVPGFWSLFRMQPESITVSQRLAHLSEETHARYFREEMGRERTKTDLLLRRFRQIADRAAHPARTLARLRDAIFPPNRQFPEARSPEWSKR